jgi:hypothetical protein
MTRRGHWRLATDRDSSAVAGTQYPPDVTLACSVGVAECPGCAGRFDRACCLPGEPRPGVVQVRWNGHAVLP